MNNDKQNISQILKDYTKKNNIMASSVILEDYAEALYNAGYRKSTDVAREIFEDFHNTLIKILNTVRDGLDKAIREDNEDAKLVHIGTEETVKCIILIFAELKKKYTQEK